MLGFALSELILVLQEFPSLRRSLCQERLISWPNYLLCLPNAESQWIPILYFHLHLSFILGSNAKYSRLILGSNADLSKVP